MTFESILFTLFQRLHGERSAQGVFHILRGKRSGQTLQDVEYYQVKSFYSLVPNMQAQDFQRVVHRMLDNGFLRVEDQLVYVTEKGEQEYVDYGWRFNGWDYRGKEREFVKRLALLVQTLSNVGNGENMFMPIQKELHIQQFVKGFLQKQSSSFSKLATMLYEELEQAMRETHLTELQCTILSYRLTGYGLTAYTWEQLSDQLQLPTTSIQLLFLESLHIILDFIFHHKELLVLKSLAVGCRVDTYLTHSAERTKKLFEHGYAIEQIASLRNLKLSTIEDHFVEMAANITDFPFRNFVSSEQITLVWNHIDRLQTKRLRILKEQCDELTYFQLRLIVIHGRQVST